MLFSNKRNQGSLEKWPNPGLGQEIYKMDLKRYIVPESKEVHTKQTNRSHIDGAVSKGPRSKMKQLPTVKAKTIWTRKLIKYYQIRTQQKISVIQYIDQ